MRWYIQPFRICCILISTYGIKYGVAQSPDTLLLSIRQAEKAFTSNNLSLLAAHYNIDANRVLIKQAKLWDNPTLTTDQNIYDKQGGFFRHDANTGQVYVQVTELIRTAGKRSKLAHLATDNTHISEEQFNDLLRTLRFTLISDLLDIDHLLQVINVYNQQIGVLETLVRAMDIQLRNGNISLKENLRVKALMFQFQNDLAALQAQLLPLENEVLLITGIDKKFIVPQVERTPPAALDTIPAMEKLIQAALLNRPDAKLARLQVEYQQHNLYLQKALAKPDITAGSEYDQRSSYAPDYVGLTISLPINIFNRNKGNIAAASFAVKQQQALSDQQANKVRADIVTVMQKINLYKKLTNEQQQSFVNDYGKLYNNVLKSYQQRQIGLLEFIDFSDAYKDVKVKLMEQETNLMKSLAELNYVVAADVITL